MKTAEEIQHWQEKAKENYIKTPLKVLQYIGVLERYASQSKWISVEDALPKNRQRVICYYPSKSTSPMDGIYDSGKWIIHGLDRTFSVTHWQPLPEPPK